MRLGVFCSATYTNQAALRAQLTAMTSGANKAQLLVTVGLNAGDQWARGWAQDNGIPWISDLPIVEAAGYAGGRAKVLAAVLAHNLDAILNATGVPANPSIPNSPQVIATARGIPYTLI